MKLSMHVVSLCSGNRLTVINVYLIQNIRKIAHMKIIKIRTKLLRKKNWTKTKTSQHSRKCLKILCKFEIFFAFYSIFQRIKCGILPYIFREKSLHLDVAISSKVANPVFSFLGYPKILQNVTRRQTPK